MNILITGGAGFIGSYTKDKLKREKDYQIYVVDNFVTGSKNNLQADDFIIEGDICDDHVYEQLRKYSFDAIIHLAAQTSVFESMNDPLYDLHENILGTVKMLLFAKENGVKKFIFSSSAAVYGDHPKIPLTEKDSLNPTSAYGVSKLCAEYYIKMFCEHHKIESTILRYANVFGPKQSKDGEGGVIKIFIDMINNKQIPCIYGDGNQTRDFIYVEDLASAHLAALKGSSGVYNVSTNIETSVNELITLLSCIIQTEINPIYFPKREGDIYRSCLDNTMIKKTLNWSPKISVKEGLIKMLSKDR